MGVEEGHHMFGRGTTVFALLAVLLLGACAGSAPKASTDVTVELTDKEITLSTTTVGPGVVNFNVVNKGTVVHSLVILRTDLPHDKIPADPSDASKVQEKGSIAVTGQMAVGATKTISRELAAGQYVLVCNEPAHYLVGMHTALVVK
jgi:uncharacterized cupredoxin-like copper-binding protein